MSQTLSATAKQYGLSQSGLRYRLDNGIPLNTPLAGNGRGGHYKIDCQTAEKIWAEIRSQREESGRAKLKSIAEQHSVPVSIVTNIATGKAWNQITGLPKYQEW